MVAQESSTESKIVSLLQAVTDSPCTAAQVLQQFAAEANRREFRPDGLRHALGTLDPNRSLSELPPTVGYIVYTLLTAENRLPQGVLADRTDVLARMIRSYRDRLEAHDLIRIDENGYRLALSFQTAAEHCNQIVPTVLAESQTLLDAADASLETILPPDRYGDLEDPLGSILFWAPDSLRLLEHPAVGSWFQLAAAFTAIEFRLYSLPILKLPATSPIDVFGSFASRTYFLISGDDTGRVPRRRAHPRGDRFCNR